MGKAELKNFLSERVFINIERRLSSFLKNRELRIHLVEKTGITNQEAQIILKIISEYIKYFDIAIKPNTIEAGDIVDLFIEGMTDGLIKEKKLNLPNFGSFRIKESKARAARNPRTGESVRIPDRNVLRFKIAGKLKRLVND